MGADRELGPRSRERGRGGGCGSTRSSGSICGRAAARTALATVAALRGDAEATERHAAAAEKVALPAGASYVLACVQQARGALALGAGRPAEAFAHLRRTFDPTDPACATVAFSILLEDLAESATTPEELAFARRALAAATPGQGASFARFILDEDAAPPRARRAVPARARAARCTACGCGAAAVWRTRASRCARRSPAFEALGTPLWAERAQRELAATAETTHRHDLDRLTPQELEIARMAARGMTNPAIAADLALSPRTVGHHLTKIFPKLEVSSRAGIAPGAGDARLRVKDGAQLAARRDAELRKDAVEVRADRAVREIQRLADLAVRQALRGHPRDLQLLR